jgi:thiol-disulfide isomerase/thioredoxin
MDIQNKQKVASGSVKAVILTALWFIAFSCSGPDTNYSVSGKLENAEGKKLVLYEMGTYSLVPIDSLIIGPDGKFRFKGEIDRARFMSLRESSLNHLTLIVLPGENIRIDADLNSLQQSASVKGSRESALAIELNRKMHSAVMQLDSLGADYRSRLGEPETNIELLRKNTSDQFEKISERQREFTIGFISRNPGSLASLMALYQQIDKNNFVLRQQEDFKYFALVDSILITKYPDLDYTITLNENVKEMVAQIGLRNERESFLAPGVVAPEISLPNPDGEIIDLSSLRGKYVLLDFWAAWCPPCREESPWLVEAYNRYQKMGFDIYQVSLDRNREAWLRGISEDRLERWKHVSDLQFWSSVVVPLYRIDGIPANFLLDPEGKIIARDLRGEELENKLTEIFN